MSLLRPAAAPRADFFVDSIFDVDFKALAALGVRGVLLDVDNTLVPPGGDRVERRVVDHVRRARGSTCIAKWALASNARRDLSPLAADLGLEVVKAGWLIAKPRSSYYRRALELLGLDAHEVAMVGDRALHDVVPASKLGLVTVLVEPCWPDQRVDGLLLRRRRERGIRMRSGRPTDSTRTA